MSTIDGCDNVGEDPLDDLLSSTPSSVFNKPKQLASVLRDAYTIGVPPLMLKSMTDRIQQSAGFSFHLGTPDVEMRRIASWLMSGCGNSPKKIRKIVRILWKRHGREDLKMVGLILANLEPDALEGGLWKLFGEVVGTREATSIVLEVIEEIFRGGHAPPELDLLKQWSQKSKIHHQISMLVIHVDWQKNKQPEVNPDLKSIIESCPVEDELMQRIQRRLLA